MRIILQILDVIELVIVPIDKTDIFRSMKMKQILTMVKYFFKKSTRDIYREKVRNIFEDAEV